MQDVKFAGQAKEAMTEMSVDSLKHIQSNATQMLVSLSKNHYQPYLGTVSDAEKARRRKKNKLARKARKLNRG